MTNDGGRAATADRDAQRVDAVAARRAARGAGSGAGRRTARGARRRPRRARPGAPSESADPAVRQPASSGPVVDTGPVGPGADDRRQQGRARRQPRVERELHGRPAPPSRGPGPRERRRRARLAGPTQRTGSRAAAGRSVASPPATRPPPRRSPSRALAASASSAAQVATRQRARAVAGTAPARTRPWSKVRRCLRVAPGRTTLASVAATSVPPRLRTLLAAAEPLAEVFDRAPVAASTSSVARFATRSSATSTSTRSTSTSRPTRAPTRSCALVRRGRRPGLGAGPRPSGRSGSALGGRTVRDHDPPRRGLPSRLAQARGHLRRRRRGRPVAPRLHDQRHGARPRVPAARRPVRGRERTSPSAGSPPRSTPRSPSATTRCGCCGPRGSSRGSSSSPTRRSSAAAARARPAARRSSRPSGSATSSTGSLLVEVPSVALWFVVRTGLAAQFLPELEALALEQDPIHRHKDVLAHTLAVVDKTSSGPPAAPRGAVPRRGQAEDARDRPRRRELPPPRGRRARG